eukprot:PITA_10166
MWTLFPYNIAPPTAISLISAKKYSKIISQMGKIIFFLIHSQTKGKVIAIAMAPRKVSSKHHNHVDTVVEGYRDILSSTTGITFHYQELNKITLRNRYPYPQIDDLMDQLKGAKYFSKIDLKSGYHQVPIEPTNVWMTTFVSKEGLFEWLVMPFRLKNAPAAYMTLMDDILQPFDNSFVVVYLENILIFRNS